jgi:uncharacterized protein YjiS (DUF1127 family)
MAVYLLQLALTRIRFWRLRRKTTMKLSSLSDHLLNDIGVDRSQIAIFADDLCRKQQAQWLSDVHGVKAKSPTPRREHCGSPLSSDLSAS